MDPSEPPWLLRTLQVLDLRRRDRLLLVLPGEVAVANAAAHRVGAQGAITVVEPHLRRAEAIAQALPAAEVLALEPVGGESFGSFDAVLATPFAPPPWPPDRWATLIAANLRPGGRFAIDLPAPEPLPAVLDAVAKARLPCLDRIAATFAGPDTTALVAALRLCGLRRVETMLGTHLLTFASPFELADLLGAVVRLDPEERGQLGEAIAHELHTATTTEVLMHRSAVAGMR